MIELELAFAQISDKGKERKELLKQASSGDGWTASQQERMDSLNAFMAPFDQVHLCYHYATVVQKKKKNHMLIVCDTLHRIPSDLLLSKKTKQNTHKHINI